jgi:anti-anti-sigma factor
MGVRTLMLGAKTVARKRGRMVVCGADENVEKVLRMTGFDEVVDIDPDYPAALAALSG